MSIVAKKFVLKNLAIDISLDTAGIISASLYKPTFTADAVADAVCLPGLLSTIFKLSVDGFDKSVPNNLVDDLTSSVKYYVVSDPATISSVDVGNAVVIKNPVSLVGANAAPLVDQTVKTDFLRYLALKLFNTPLATDLFLNQELLDDDANSKFNAAWTQLVTNNINVVSTNGSDTDLLGVAGSKYLTNSITSDKNLCRELYMQMASQQAARFSNFSNTFDSQSLPFVAGDSVSFQVTMSAAANQVLFGGDAILPRSYEIRIVHTAV